MRKALYTASRKLLPKHMQMLLLVRHCEAISYVVPSVISNHSGTRYLGSRRTPPRGGTACGLPDCRANNSGRTTLFKRWRSEWVVAHCFHAIGRHSWNKNSLFIIRSPRYHCYLGCMSRVLTRTLRHDIYSCKTQTVLVAWIVIATLGKCCNLPARQFLTKTQNNKYRESCPSE